MIKEFYKRHQYYCNMVAILVLVIFNRFLDRLAWIPDYEKKLSDALIDFSIEFITFLFVIYFIVYVYKVLIRRKIASILVPVTFLFALFIPAAVLYVSTSVEQNILGMKVLPLTFNLIKQYTPGGAVIIFFLSITYYLTYLKIQSAENIEKAHKAESLAKEVQLKMLRYQINPHFLFNVLNSIHSLIDENTIKAKKLVVDMSEYYRYTLNKQVQTISLEKEIESVQKYLDIQKTRFEDDFQFEIEVNNAARELLIPSFIIHLLIENAVKYGSISGNEILKIKLCITFERGTLTISVANSGHLFVADTHTGVKSDGTGSGLENLKKRLELYYDNNCSFTIKEEQGWVIAKIEINKTNLL